MFWGLWLYENLWRLGGLVGLLAELYNNAALGTYNLKKLMFDIGLH